MQKGSEIKPRIYIYIYNNKEKVAMQLHRAKKGDPQVQVKLLLVQSAKAELPVSHLTYLTLYSVRKIKKKAYFAVLSIKHGFYLSNIKKREHQTRERKGKG